MDLFWDCKNCGKRVSATEPKCECGYEATQYDLAGSAEDTGNYLASRISTPSLETMVTEQSSAWNKLVKVVIVAMAAGATLAIMIIIVLKLLHKHH